MDTADRTWKGSGFQVRSVHRWRTEPRYQASRAGLEALIARALAGDDDARQELIDAFTGTVPIGTGGRRGACGIGPNRVSELLVRETVQALVSVIEAEGAPRKVAVVYDTRRDSRRFAHVAARHMHAAGLEVLLVDAPRATPVLSFLVRARGCGGGVVISASHNPPEDNGVKIYGRDGAQVLGARDAALTEAIKVAATTPLPPLDMDAAAPGRADGFFVFEGDRLAREIDEPYLQAVLDVGVLEGDLSDAGIEVVYSPLHGVGHTGVLPALRARGVSVHAVESQVDPDGGRFSTVRSANPEDPAAFALGLELARERGAALVLATVPDAARLGALVREGGGYTFIDGNRLGVLMLDHVLRHGTEPRPVLTTLVTTPLTATLARASGVETIDDLLVGFKHHAGVAEEAAAGGVLFATEESHGYVRGDAVRDKDGAMAALLLTECAVDCRRHGQTLLDRLEEIWAVHGYHREKTSSIYARGVEGRAAIENLMRAWRAAAPRAFGGLTVTSMEDRLRPRATGSWVRDLPGNVLSFELRGEGESCRLVLRPSGTEPKVKVYTLARAEPGGDLGARRETVDALIDRVAADATRQAEATMNASGSP